MRRLDPLVAAGDPGRVVAAEADAPDPDPVLVDAGQAGHRVDDGPARYLPVRPDRQVVLSLALTRSVDRDGGDPAAEEQVLGGPELLLRRVQAGYEHDDRMRAWPGRTPEHRRDRGAVERYLDALARRIEECQRVARGPDGHQVGRPHLRRIVDEHELREVVVDGRLRQMGPGRAGPVCRERIPAEFLVHRSSQAPLLAPGVPALDRPGHADEVAVVDAIGYEARRPMADGR